MKKMIFSVQRLFVESFKFNNKSVRAFYIKDVGQCRISQDVYIRPWGYDRENAVKTMQRLVPAKYKMRLGEAMIDMKEVDKNVHLHPDTVLLKEPSLSFKMQEGLGRTVHRMGSGNSFATRGSKISLNH